jgi:hypothetical protein
MNVDVEATTSDAITSIEFEIQQIRETEVIATRIHTEYQMQYSQR